MQRANLTKTFHRRLRDIDTLPRQLCEHSDRPDSKPDNEMYRHTLRQEQKATTPPGQFMVQRNAEHKRLNGVLEEEFSLFVPKSHIGKVAEAIVRNRWIEQGIWNSEWEGEEPSTDDWKHENPFEYESKPENLDSATLPSDRSVPSDESSSDLEHLSLAGEAARPFKDMTMLKRDHELTRPNHQFYYQLEQERQRLQAGRSSTDFTRWVTINMDQEAYNAVKNKWLEHGIWDARWGFFPGDKWKHEYTLDELVETTPSVAFSQLPDTAGYAPDVKTAHETSTQKSWTNGPTTKDLATDTLSKLVESSRPRPEDLGPTDANPQIESQKAAQDVQPRRHLYASSKLPSLQNSLPKDPSSIVAKPQTASEASAQDPQANHARLEDLANDELSERPRSPRHLLKDSAPSDAKPQAVSETAARPHGSLSPISRPPCPTPLLSPTS